MGVMTHVLDMRKKSKARQDQEAAERRAFERISGMRDGPLRIVTTAGTCVIGPTTRLFVRVKDGFVQATASDLKRSGGQQVLWEKEGIVVEEHRERIDEMLREGQIYRYAMSALFEDTKTGWTTRFRQALWRGVLAVPERWTNKIADNISSYRSEIEDILAGRGEPSDDLARRVALRLHVELVERLAPDQLHAVSTHHIQNGWLAGRVIAPRNFKEVFQVLGDLAPQLLEMERSPEFEQHYWLYRAMRLAASLRLSNIIRGEGTGKAAVEREHGMHLTPEARRELDELLLRFAEEIGPRHAAVGVLRVEPVGKRTDAAPAGVANEIPLRNGLVTEKPEGLKEEVLTPEDISRRRAALYNLHRDVGNVMKAVYMVEHGLPAQSSSMFSTDLPIGLVGYEDPFDLTRRMIQRAREAGIDYQSWKELETTEALEHGKRFLKEADALLRGRFEEWAGVNRQTTLRLFEQMGQVMSALPFVFHYLGFLEELSYEQSINGQQSGENIDRERRYARKLLARMGWQGEYSSPKEFLRSFFRNDTLVTELVERSIITVGDVQNANSSIYDGRDEATLKKLITFMPTLVKSFKNEFLSAAEEKEIWGKLGVGQIPEALTTLYRLGFRTFPFRYQEMLRAHFTFNMEWKAGGRE